MANLKIYQNSEEPIYKQIARQFKEEILTGKRKQGEYLPSIRVLAQELKISVITTMKAYESLCEEGLITASQGKGYYVNAQNEAMLMEQHLRQCEGHLLDAIECAKIARISKEELIDMLSKLMEVE